MVYSVERKVRAVRGSGSHYAVDDREKEEDGGGAFPMERSKPPLHNFNFSFLKWGNQKHLRCMKDPDSTTGAENGGGGKSGEGRFSIVSDVSADRRRRNRSPPPSRYGGGKGNYDARRFRPPRFGGGGGEEGIEAVREKLMLDLKEQADKMKNQILRRNQVSDDDEESDEEEGEVEREDEGDRKQERKLQSRPLSQSPIPAPTVAVVPTAADKSKEEARPWNLRTRRAACKAPALSGGNSAPTAKGRIEEKKGSSSNNNNNNSPLRSDGAKSPRLRGERREREEKEKERPKFSVELSKKEVEEDFLQILGHRPARRPKKRPRVVQRQLDTLFPGLWLTEVSADAYKVPEIPETGKR